MYKQLPSRNNRSKGIKVKRILQICLLLAVCFWLIYQVKRSHEKKKEFDGKEAKLVADMESAGGIMKLGRKDLPRLDNASKDEKQVEDDEENEVEEEEDKHEEDEQERDDTKVDEREEDEEDMSRGGGDDELDDHDLEKSEAEAEHDEEFMDDEREREEVVDDTSEENGDNGKKSHLVSETSKDEQDHNGARQNNHEAQEELYKADDASSEVAHDTDSSIPARTDTSGILEQSTEGKVLEPVRSTNGTAEEQNPAADNLTDLKNSSLPNSTRSMESAAEDAETVSILSDGTRATFNISGEESLKGSTDTTDSEKGQGIVDKSVLTSDRNLAEAAANTTEHDSAGDVKSLSSSSKNMTMDGLTKGQTNIQDNSKTEGIADGRSDSQSEVVNTDSVVHDPIDASDTSMGEEEKEARMDLSTLPEIRDDVGNVGEVAEE